jgi:hypothetical protein
VGNQVEYCENKPQGLQNEMLMYVGMEGQLHASWNPLLDGSKDFGYPEFVSDFSQRSRSDAGPTFKNVTIPFLQILTWSHLWLFSNNT